MNQRIDGNNNIQARDNAQVNLYGRPLPSPDNPALMPCPACGRPVSRTANECPDCKDDLAWRREVAWEQERKARTVTLVTRIGSLGAVAYGVGLLIPAISGASSIVVLVSLLLIAATLNQK